MKKLKNYQEILTGDGSVTYYSELYGEACHSTSGAINETNLHYIKGCLVEDLAEKFSTVNIFETGFGVGIGFFETLRATSQKKSFLNFISTEIDTELVEHILDKNQITYTKEKNSIIAKSSHYQLIVLLGDARKSIKTIELYFQEKFDAIYQDAFSPKKNASLWTAEWFEALRNIGKESCIMSTYSASSSVRKSMLAGGWYLYKGDQFGTKRSSTRARLQGDSDQEILDHLEKSPAITITDKNYKDYTIGLTHEKNKTN